MSHKSDFMCAICKMVVDDPVVSPCQCVVCGHHLQVPYAQSRRIKCEACQEEFDAPAKGFSTIKMIKDLLDKDIHLNETEKELKYYMQGLMREIGFLRDAFKQAQTDFDQVSGDHFATIRQKIETRRDTIKARIDSVANTMLNHTYQKEDFFKQKSRATANVFSEIDIDQASRAISNEFRKLNLDMKNIERIESEQCTQIRDLKSRINDLTLVKAEVTQIACREHARFSGFRLNSQMLISCSADNSIKLWDLDTFACVHTLVGHKSTVQCVEVCESNRVISSSWDKTIKIWSLSNGVCIHTLNHVTSKVNCIKALTPSVIAYDSFYDIIVWDLANSCSIQTLYGHTSLVTCLVYLPDGRLASGSHDKTVKVWDLGKGECVKTLEDHTGNVTCLALLEKGFLASGSMDNSVKVWDIDSGECVRTLLGHSSDVRQILSAKNGDLISCSSDNTIKVWNVISGECMRTLGGHAYSVNCIRLTHEGELVSGGDDGSINVWDLETGVCLESLRGHTESVNDLNLVYCI